MKKRSTKEIKQQAKKALQGHIGTVILGLLAVYGLNMLGTILSTNLFSGTSVLDLVLSEVFMLVVSLIVGIISAGLGYMLLNISRGKEFSLGDLGYFFKNQPDRVIIAGFVLALILSGGLGNMIDRVRMGYVVDYIYLSFFPAIFNFADCCVVAGAILAVLGFLIAERRTAKAKAAEASHE